MERCTHAGRGPTSIGHRGYYYCRSSRGTRSPHQPRGRSRPGPRAYSKKKIRSATVTGNINRVHPATYGVPGSEGESFPRHPFTCLREHALNFDIRFGCDLRQGSRGRTGGIKSVPVYQKVGGEDRMRRWTQRLGGTDEGYEEDRWTAFV